MLISLLAILLAFLTLSAAQSQANLTCIPYGICERCPDEALHQPYCQPFGNRRLMHCRASIQTEPASEAGKRPQHAQGPPPSSDTGDPSLDGQDNGLILAWESCGRVVLTERADFFEFTAVNLMFSCVGVGVVVWRSRRMEVFHARQLAARIGLGGRTR